MVASKEDREEDEDEEVGRTTEGVEGLRLDEATAVVTVEDRLAGVFRLGVRRVRFFLLDFWLEMDVEEEEEVPSSCDSISEEDWSSSLLLPWSTKASPKSGSSKAEPFPSSES